MISPDPIAALRVSHDRLVSVAAPPPAVTADGITLTDLRAAFKGI